MSYSVSDKRATKPCSNRRNALQRNGLKGKKPFQKMSKELNPVLSADDVCSVLPEAAPE
jgi:hypothetical protein